MALTRSAGLATDTGPRLPTSAVLDRLVQSQAAAITLAGLLDGLAERSFGMLMLVLGLIGMAPGLSVVAGVLLILLAGQMILRRPHATFPQALARRRLPEAQLRALAHRAVPVLRRLESIIRPRWPRLFQAVAPLVGFVVLVLALLLLVPVPLSNVLPGLGIVLIAFAYLEKDGALLCLAVLAALVPIAVTGAAVWALLAGALLALQ